MCYIFIRILNFLTTFIAYKVDLTLYCNMHVKIMTLNDINLTYNGYKFQRMKVLSLSPASAVNDSPN